MKGGGPMSSDINHKVSVFKELNRQEVNLNKATSQFIEYYF